ncbi:MAG: tetratricopeptide repeat protein [Planctomycetales bacterium]|nr:tetratricopeptide repeat protein [Planctomycetales bacterium]
MRECEFAFALATQSHLFETGIDLAEQNSSWKGSMSLFTGVAALALSLAALYRSFNTQVDLPVSAVQQPEANLVQEKEPASSALETAVGQQIHESSQPRAVTVRLPVSETPATKEELEAEATRVAERLQQVLPEEPMALHVAALLHAQLHSTAQAEELWKRCIQLDPRTEPYYINLAAIALDRGDSQLAVDTLHAAQTAGIDSPNVKHHLGIALNGLGRSQEAIEVAKSALATEPNSAAHWMILGQAQLQSGLNEEAEQSLRRAVDLGARTKAAYFSLFNVCMRLGKRDEAKQFRDIYASFKEDGTLSAEDRYQVLSESEARRVCVSVLSEAAALYVAIPDSQNAEMLYLRILALDPKNQSACRELADIYQQRSTPGDEQVVRERIVELDPLNLMNYLELAKAYVAGGESGKAESAIKLAISLSPSMVTGYAAMTDFLLEDQQPAKAQWYVERAVELKPSSQGYSLLARTLRAQGLTEEAQAADAMSAKLKAQVNSSAGRK